MTAAPVSGGAPARSPSPASRPGAPDTSLSAAELALYMDHRVNGVALLPGAACLARSLAAARRHVGGPAVLRDVRFESAAVLDPQRPLGLRVVVEPGEGGVGRVVVESDRPGAPTRYMSATFCAATAVADPPINVRGCAERLGAEREGREVYSRLAAAGNDYGPAFRRVSRVWGAGTERLASIDEAPGAARELDVISVDAALHALGEAAAAEASRRSFVLAGIDYVSLPESGSPRWARVVAARAADGAAGGEARLLDEGGR